MLLKKSWGLKCKTFKVYQNDFCSEQSRPKRSQGEQKGRKEYELRSQPKRLCVQANSKGTISMYIGNTSNSNEGLSDAHTEEFIPLQIATLTLTSSSIFPTQCVEDGTQAAPLDSQANRAYKDVDMGDTPPMTEEQKGGQGCNYNPIDKQTNERKLRQKNSTIECHPRVEQKEVVKEIGFGGFLNLLVDMITGKLALWLVWSFDTCSCSLPLAHNRLRVTEHDVYMILALPKGPLKTIEDQFPTLGGWTNDKIKSREEEEFEVGFGKSALDDRLDETKVPDEAQEVHEEELSNATPNPLLNLNMKLHNQRLSCIHYLTPKIISFDQALLEDGKVSNEIITNSRALAGVMTELEKLLPNSHALLKRARTTAIQTTSDALFAHITLLGNSKSTTPVLSPDSYEPKGFLLEVEAIKKQFLSAQKSKHDFPQFTLPSFSLCITQEENQPITTKIFIHEPEPQEENDAPGTGVVIRELDADVPI
ncbi:LOW QUALITY PROTEIN: hypothetical protein Cgig2_008291 [Carnegiea gigantea]|uniref:Uncharacterized protein n=1 Tax=Carnegiea gigantea TaxID=171969 RepID=A0A9Q1JJH7_9CARY|nr:LOW QUALITY PROTEIN: hypothetical protein Cgig2_008291 [Carnegiea gigantea]